MDFWLEQGKQAFSARSAPHPLCLINSALALSSRLKVGAGLDWGKWVVWRRYNQKDARDSCGQSFKWCVLAVPLPLNFAPYTLNRVILGWRWMFYKGLRGKMGCWPGEFCKKIAICFLEKEIPIFRQGRPQGHPGGKSGFPADKKQSGSFAKVYRH